jgi:murein DD-endopeptidase MepM/ murein hydrolase activator NlpD
VTNISDKSRRAVAPILLAALLLLCACASERTPGANPARVAAEAAPPGAARFDERLTLDDYLKADIPVADGFDFPVGDPDGKGSYTDAATGEKHEGWHVATRFNEEYALGLHPGEDWNGRGGGATDLGQPVRAVAAGRVVFAAPCGQPWGNVVIVEHLFYENHLKRRVRSLYAHLKEIGVREGGEVGRRQSVGTVGQDPGRTFAPHLHLEIRRDPELSPTFWPSSNGKDAAWIRERYAEPSSFIAARRSLFVPQKEAALVLVEQESYKARLYREGRLAGEYDVSLGQARGEKRVEGDNRTPKGMYFVVQKHRGDIPGPYGAYYGGHWVKVNYPNRHDAERGLAEGLVTRAQAAKIADAWTRRAPTPQDTRLGGGIGFHGWVREWPDDGPRHLSWGCVVLHLSDVSSFYDQVPEGAMVIIF